MFYGWKSSHSDFELLHLFPSSAREMERSFYILFGFSLRSSHNDALNQNILWISIPFRLAQIFILRQTINANELETPAYHPTAGMRDDGVDIVYAGAVSCNGLWWVMKLVWLCCGVSELLSFNLLFPEININIFRI